ncbi:hypothetical protein [Celeribacter halophilus]|uniref:hypothetical protein n=1 Tax=Celeribacter halophilus TaxID=576117 RepID=UPI001C0A19EC|nr:hypothetical protein [Celeribacter halophilus]MBU2888235.1 hypothetical protein [Celeribacter halophilus]MDO6512292.1 hypothetical protein [Celeribacter halophilus]
MSENMSKNTAQPCAWIHYARPRPHWYLVNDIEQAKLKADWAAVEVKARVNGGICTGTYHIRGQHDFETVSVWIFPTSLAAYEHWQALVEARYSEFFAFTNNIGLELEGSNDV